MFIKNDFKNKFGNLFFGAQNELQNQIMLHVLVLFYIDTADENKQIVQLQICVSNYIRDHPFNLKAEWRGEGLWVFSE